MGPSRSLVALGVASLLALGCSAETRYRRTALVPAPHPIPWDGRVAKKGSLRVEGSLTRTDVATDLAPGSEIDVQLGPTGYLSGISRNDTLVRVPQLTGEGAVLGAIAPWAEIGLRGTLGAYAGARSSAVGTLPLKGSPNLFGAGPEVRFAFDLGKKSPFALGIAANWLFQYVPAAQWEIDGACPPSETCQQGYRLIHQEHVFTPVLAAGIYPSFRLPGDDYGHVFLVLATQQTYKNDGRSNQAAGDLLSTDGFTGMAGFGYGLPIGIFRGSALVAWPSADSHDAIDHDGPILSITLGVAPLLSAEPEDRVRVKRPEPEPDSDEK